MWTRPCCSRRNGHARRATPRNNGAASHSVVTSGFGCAPRMGRGKAVRHGALHAGAQYRLKKNSSAARRTMTRCTACASWVKIAAVHVPAALTLRGAIARGARRRGKAVSISRAPAAGDRAQRRDPRASRMNLRPTRNFGYHALGNDPTNQARRGRYKTERREHQHRADQPCADLVCVPGSGRARLAEPDDSHDLANSRGQSPISAKPADKRQRRPCGGLNRRRQNVWKACKIDQKFTDKPVERRQAGKWRWAPT